MPKEEEKGKEYDENIQTKMITFCKVKLIIFSSLQLQFTGHLFLLAQE